LRIAVIRMLHVYCAIKLNRDLINVLLKITYNAYVSLQTKRDNHSD